MNLGKSFLYYFYYLRERSTVYQEWKWSSWALDPQDGHEVQKIGDLLRAQERASSSSPRVTASSKTIHTRS
jgi:hypothetical protein